MPLGTPRDFPRDAPSTIVPSTADETYNYVNLIATNYVAMPWCTLGFIRFRRFRHLDSMGDKGWERETCWKVEIYLQRALGQPESNFSLKCRRLISACPTAFFIIFDKLVGGWFALCVISDAMQSTGSEDLVYELLNNSFSCMQIAMSLESIGWCQTINIEFINGFFASSALFAARFNIAFRNIKEMLLLNRLKIKSIWYFI